MSVPSFVESYRSVHFSLGKHTAAHKNRFVLLIEAIKSELKVCVTKIKMPPFKLENALVILPS
jgi:hypothetical protein